MLVLLLALWVSGLGLLRISRLLWRIPLVLLVVIVSLVGCVPAVLVT